MALITCMEGSLFCFRKWQWMLWSRDNVIMDGICLRQRDNSWSLENCFVAVDGICSRRMLVGGTAEVQVRDPRTLTLIGQAVTAPSALTASPAAHHLLAFWRRMFASRPLRLTYTIESRNVSVAELFCLSAFPLLVQPRSPTHIFQSCFPVFSTVSGTRCRKKQLWSATLCRF